MRDLVEHQVLLVGPEGRLPPINPERDKNAGNIFSVSKRQGDAFVRWVVEQISDGPRRRRRAGLAGSIPVG